MSRQTIVRFAGVGILGTLLAVAGGTAANASPTPRSTPGSWQVTSFGHAPSVMVNGKPFAVTGPDDITSLGGNLFVNYQNGVGPRGEPATAGTTFSTIIEYSRDGRVRRSWNLTGKSDGLTADPATGLVISTLNEDGNSSLATINPEARAGHQVVLYSYASGNPLPHGGGTDAVSIYHGKIFISASAPGAAATPVSPSPAVYQADLDRTSASTGTVSLKPVFYDTSTATVANTAAPTSSSESPNPPSYGAFPTPGSTVTLALTDPDSSEIVPPASPRFAGDFVLDSQGDQQLIFDRQWGTHQNLSVLFLLQSIDDSAYVSDEEGAIYFTNATTNEIVRLRGNLTPGEVLVSATPGDANNSVTAPNYLATLDLNTGSVTAVAALSALHPKGMIFMSGDRDRR